METIDHFVEFDKYCKTCKFRDKNDKKGEEPCNDCLDNPINQDSRKPVNYKEDPDEIERLEKEENKLEENKYKLVLSELDLIEIKRLREVIPFLR